MIGDVVRRVPQVCAERARAACLLLAINRDAVTRGNRNAVRQRRIAVLAEDSSYALARGAGGIAGVASSKAGESEAMDGALAARRALGTGTGCAISAIGPYLVRQK